MGSERAVTRNKILCPHCGESQYGTDVDIDDMVEDEPESLTCCSCERKFTVILCKRDYWFHTRPEP